MKAQTSFENNIKKLVLNNEKFCDKNLSIIEHIANKYQINTVSKEDLIQEGFLGLMEAEKKYDPNQGTEFGTYAYYWIKKYMLAAIKKEIEHSKKTNSIEDVSVAEIKDEEEKENVLIEEAKSEDLKVLDEIEQKVYKLIFVEQKTLLDVAETINLSREKVRQIKQKIIRKLKTKSY